MKRHTQIVLYHVLPVAFWLLAIGGIVIWAMYHLPLAVSHYIPALLAWISVSIIRHIPRHADSVEPCFQVALLLGIAAYWLPSILFLMIPIWGYLIYQNLFNLRAFSASLIGLALVVVWVILLNYFSVIPVHFSLANNLSLWIPTGAILIAYLAATTARQTLRVR